MATVKEMLADIAAAQNEQLERCTTCRAELEKHGKTLYGNGKLGLVGKMAIVFWVLGLVGTAAAIALADIVKTAVCQ